MFVKYFVIRFGIILLACVVGSIAHRGYHYGLEAGDTCYSPDGFSGVCTPTRDCRTQLYEFGRPILCSDHGAYSTVCCLYQYQYEDWHHGPYWPHPEAHHHSDWCLPNSQTNNYPHQTAFNPISSTLKPQAVNERPDRNQDGSLTQDSHEISPLVLNSIFSTLKPQVVPERSDGNQDGSLTQDSGEISPPALNPISSTLKPQAVTERSDGNQDGSLTQVSGEISPPALNLISSTLKPQAVTERSDGNQDGGLTPASGGTSPPTPEQADVVHKSASPIPLSDTETTSKRPDQSPPFLSGTRISDRKCAEYADDLAGMVKEQSPTAVERCAWHTEQQPGKFYATVFGGDDADRGEFPHMAALGWPLLEGGFDFNCGGSLISESYILTAGHCLVASNRDNTLSSLEPTIVRLGDANIKDGVVDNANPITVGVKRTIKHPLYDPPVKYNDIGLIEMERPVQFRLDIRPACLWSVPDFGENKFAVVTGWGAIAHLGDRSDLLQKASLSLFSNAACDTQLASVRNRNWRDGFADHQICAGDLLHGHDTCKGDSGGPLALGFHRHQCLFTVVGVTSFGKPCGTLEAPGVYTRVSSFVDWIESVVWAA